MGYNFLWSRFGIWTFNDNSTCFLPQMLTLTNIYFILEKIKQRGSYSLAQLDR